MKIAFIGLGNMGFPMAVRLAEHGHQVYGRDALAESTAKFAATTNNSHELTVDHLGEVDVLITMLPNSAIVEAVLLQDGVADGLSTGTLVIDMSSSEPTRSRELGSALAAKGLRYADAPVSGGVKGATEGTLAIMIGGDAQDLADATDLFGVMGRSVIHVGPTGAGHAAKALNNLVSAASVAVTVEALHIAECFGIEGEKFVDVLNASSGRSNTSENKAKQFMLSGTFASGFPIGLMTKDVNIALNLAEELSVPVTLSAEVAALWRRVSEDDHAAEDHTVMYKLI
jgi:3-hydroxyisobutyrate dehydrogenase